MTLSNPTIDDKIKTSSMIELGEDPDVVPRCAKDQADVHHNRLGKFLSSEHRKITDTDRRQLWWNDSIRQCIPMLMSVYTHIYIYIQCTNTHLHSHTCRHDQCEGSSVETFHKLFLHPTWTSPSHWGRPGTNAAAAPAPGTVKWVWILIGPPMCWLGWLMFWRGKKICHYTTSL